MPQVFLITLMPLKLLLMLMMPSIDGVGVGVRKAKKKNVSERFAVAINVTQIQRSCRGFQIKTIWYTVSSPLRRL